MGPSYVGNQDVCKRKKLLILMDYNIARVGIIKTYGTDLGSPERKVMCIFAKCSGPFIKSIYSLKKHTFYLLFFKTIPCVPSASGFPSVRNKNVIDRPNVNATAPLVNFRAHSSELLYILQRKDWLRTADYTGLVLNYL